MKEKWVVNGYTVIGGEDDFSDCKPLSQSLSFDRFEDAAAAFHRKVADFASAEDHNALFDENGVFAPWEEYEWEEIFDADDFEEFRPDAVETLETIRNTVHELQKFIADPQYVPAKIEAKASDNGPWFDITCSKIKHRLVIKDGYDCDGNDVDHHLSSNVFDMTSPDEPYYFIAYSWINGLAHGINLWLTKVETEE